MISIDITNEFIYALEVSGKRNKTQFKSFCTLPLTKPIIKNDVLDSEYVGKIIKEAIKDMKSKDIYLTLSSETVVSNEYILPYDKKDSHMRNMIWSNISSALTDEKYVMDYSVMSVFTEGQTQKCRVCAYLIQRSLVESFSKIIEKLGKTPKSFDIPQNCMYKFCKKYFGQSTIMLANICKDQIKIHLFNAPDNILTRTTIMSEVNTYNTSKIDISEEEKILDSAADQISKMFQFQAIKQHDKIITAIYLLGDLADEKTVSFLEDRFDTRVNILGISGTENDVNKVPLDKYAYCIGAIM